MTAWFGEPWGAPVCHSSPRVPVPVGEDCHWCEERIVDGDSGFGMPTFGWAGATTTYMHKECFMRMIVGSVGHQLKVCGCFGGTDDCEPSNMSKREAAQAAADLFMRLQKGNDGRP